VAVGHDEVTRACGSCERRNLANFMSSVRETIGSMFTDVAVPHRKPPGDIRDSHLTGLPAVRLEQGDAITLRSLDDADVEGKPLPAPSTRQRLFVTG
jgi:hypothetical protein